MKWLCAMLVSAVVLVGCDPAAPFDLSKVTVPDLQAALARATAADDKPAIQCYAGLIPIIQSLPGQIPDPNFAGVVDAFEAARILSKKAQGFSGANNPLIQNVNLACAALFNDTQGDLLRLGLKFRP
jgi:hypothetical protein